MPLTTPKVAAEENVDIPTTSKGDFPIGKGDCPSHSEVLETGSVKSFCSIPASHQQLDTKADMVSSLLTMLGCSHDADDMAKTLLAMSSSPDSCAAMRQSGCMPLLIRLIHDPVYEKSGINIGARQRAGKSGEVSEVFSLDRE